MQGSMWWQYMTDQNILVIGFQKYDRDMYPPLYCFIDQLSKYTNLKYYHFRERGWFTNLNHLKVIRILLVSIIDTIGLLLRKENYQYIIAVDQYAYTIACLVFRGKTVVLWSHDIYGYAKDSIDNSFMKSYRKIQKYFLTKNQKIIIQDNDRLDLLKRILIVENVQLDVFFMPIFLNSVDIKLTQSMLSAKPIVLQCGGLSCERLSDKLLRHYQNNYTHYTLFFHGFITNDIMSLINESEMLPIISNVRVPGDKVSQVIDKCDIGFIGYSQTDLNFYYISRASGQLVEFLRMGKPVIVLSKTNMNEFVELHTIGVGIKDIDQLNDAIETIKANYAFYSANCLDCFRKYYDGRLYIPKLLKWLDDTYF
jgi:glycosyltransferase involved in cell wall biosynthesis